MTKIFSTPKEVLTRVEAIPPADMEKIQKLLDSYIGKDLELPSELASATVIRELERSGWVVRDTGYSVYKVHPKNLRIVLRPGVKTYVVPLCVINLPMFILFAATCWDHVVSGMIVTALFVIVLTFLIITDV